MKRAFPSSGIAAVFAVTIVMSAPSAFGQVDALSLSSGSAAPNGTISLNLSLNSPGGSQPAGVQWTLTYPPSNVVSISATAGAASTSAGKSIYCFAGSGNYSCQVTGTNTNIIGNGVVAVVNLTIAAGVSSTSIGVSSTYASSASGYAIATSSTGGTVTGGGATLSTLSCAPTSLSSGNGTTCTVTLNASAPTGGTAVSLSSNNSLLRVPGASVTVPSGATSATFTATAGTIPSNQSATLTATLAGVSKTATVSLMAPVVLTSLACSPTSLSSGGATTCTITLGQGAPAGGMVVSLSSSNASLPVPGPSVTVPATATSTSFSATAGSIATNQSATLMATLSGVSKSVTISLVAPPTPQSLACTPTTLIPLAATTCTVTLTTSAPAGGAAVLLASNNPLLPVPGGSVTVAAGATSATFAATAGIIPTNQSAILTASLNGASASSTISLLYLIPSSLACNPSSVASNSTTTCTVTLNAGAPTAGNAVAVTLSTGSGSLTIPAQVTIAPGSLSGTFSASAGTVRLSQPAKITATFNGASVAGVLQISSTGIGNSLHAPGISCSPRAVHAGGQVACEVQIVPGSPGEPIQVTSSSDQVKVPAVVSARAQHSSLTFQAVTEASARLQSATVTATVGGVQVADAVLVLPADGPVLTVPTRELVKIGERLSFAVGAVDPGGLAVQLAATGLPEGASFDPATDIFSWIPGSSQGGQYTVTFTATNSAGQISTARVSLEAGRGIPVLDSSGISCSPNSIGVLNGRWLVNGEPIGDPSGDSFELSGTEVRVNDQAAPILFASPTELHFVCPVLSAGTNLAIVVETPAGTTGPLYSTMQAFSPRVILLDGVGQAQIFFAGTSDLVTPRTYTLRGQPARPGDRVSLWATGLGVPDQIAPGRVAVKFGDLYAEAYSVHAVSGYAGIEAVEVQVPVAAEAGIAVPVCIQLLSPAGQQVTSHCADTTIEVDSE